MATDRVSITLQCVVCPAELQMPTSARHTGHGYAELVVDASAVRQHIAEHEDLPDRCCGCVGPLCCNCGDGQCSTS